MYHRIECINVELSPSQVNLRHYGTDFKGLDVGAMDSFLSRFRATDTRAKSLGTIAYGCKEWQS